jgi:hypothetical protein
MAPPRSEGEIWAADGNTSGMGGGAPVPVAIAQGWNWGAFTLPFFWGIAHRAWLALLCLVGLACPPAGVLTTLLVAVIFGAYGNQWGWQNRRWESVEHFQRTQVTWARWGLGLMLGSVLLGALFALLMLARGMG